MGDVDGIVSNTETVMDVGEEHTPSAGCSMRRNENWKVTRKKGTELTWTVYILSQFLPWFVYENTEVHDPLPALFDTCLEEGKLFAFYFVFMWIATEFQIILWSWGLQIHSNNLLNNV